MVKHKLQCWLFMGTFGSIIKGSVSVGLYAVALVQWLRLPAWKVGDRGFEPHSGLQVSKKQNVSSSLTGNNSILWGTSVTEK